MTSMATTSAAACATIATTAGPGSTVATRSTAGSSTTATTAAATATSSASLGVAWRVVFAWQPPLDVPVDLLVAQVAAAGRMANRHTRQNRIQVYHRVSTHACKAPARILRGASVPALALSGALLGAVGLLFFFVAAIGQAHLGCFATSASAPAHDASTIAHCKYERRLLRSGKASASIAASYWAASSAVRGGAIGTGFVTIHSARLARAASVSSARMAGRSSTVEMASLTRAGSRRPTWPIASAVHRRTRRDAPTKKPRAQRLRAGRVRSHSARTRHAS